MTKEKRESVPILIISYNNYKYVQNTINQILKINPSYQTDIIIIDNNSTDYETKLYLTKINVNVYYNTININPPPQITPNINEHLYNQLPEKFILTDPDLEFNINLPNNFIEQLIKLSDKYETYKIGFALRIDDYNLMYDNIYFKNKTIYEWENQFWNIKIDNPDYILYDALIDTTFSLHNKKYINNNYNIRIGGEFVCRHLPWYKYEYDILTIYEKYQLYLKQTKISTISTIVLSYINNNFVMIKKNNECFFIENNISDQNLRFWIDIFNNWEKETFDTFDKYLDPNKIFIDIGGWIGTTCIYASLKSSHVYVIEADKLSFNDLIKNSLINSKNITSINKAIFHTSNQDIIFGKNNFLNESKLNDSTSHIYLSNNNVNSKIYLNSEQYYIIKTITINDIIEQYKINLLEISLIKVDIEGGEEYILNDLYQLYLLYKIPLYISFHYTWWNDMNLDRFTFLSNDNKILIKQNPFITILFN